MTALPKDNQTTLVEADDISAYNVCLDFERNATSGDEVMHARVLGYLILHAPSLHARHEIVEEIHLCHRNYDRLSELGQFFITSFIRPFKKFKGRTPASSSHPSCPLFDKGKMDIMAAIKEAPKNHRDAKRQALIHDGFKCVATGKYDMDAAESYGISKEELRRTGVVDTECAHIIPHSTYWSSHTDSAAVNFASVSTVLKRFGYDVTNASGDKMHSLQNVMTMEKNMHNWFARLLMWFEATNIKDCYLVGTASPYIKVPERVTLISTQPDTLAVPSPELLALHAACARVAHLSGAGEYIDKFNQYVEDLDILTPDGTSADVLCYALNGFGDPISQSWGPGHAITATDFSPSL